MVTEDNSYSMAFAAAAIVDDSVCTAVDNFRFDEVNLKVSYALPCDMMSILDETVVTV